MSQINWRWRYQVLWAGKSRWATVNFQDVALFAKSLLKLLLKTLFAIAQELFWDLFEGINSIEGVSDTRTWANNQKNENIVKNFYMKMHFSHHIPLSAETNLCRRLSIEIFSATSCKSSFHRTPPPHFDQNLPPKTNWWVKPEGWKVSTSQEDCLQDCREVPVLSAVYFRVFSNALVSFVERSKGKKGYY